MNTQYWVYILKCSDDSYYTGFTSNLVLRFKQHEEGIAEGYTKNRRPLKLIYSRAFNKKDEAFKAERQIKGWSRKKKEAMIQGDWGEVSRLATGGK